MIVDVVLARHGGRGTFKALLFLIVGLGFPIVLAWVVTPAGSPAYVAPAIFFVACLIGLPFAARSLLTLNSVLTQRGRAVWLEGDHIVFTGDSQIVPSRIHRGEIESVLYFEERGYDTLTDRPMVRLKLKDGRVRDIDLFDVVKVVPSLSEAIEGWRSASLG